MKRALLLSILVIGSISLLTVSFVGCAQTPPEPIVSFSGHGNDVTSEFRLEDGVAIFTITHSGEGYLGVSLWTTQKVIESSGETYEGPAGWSLVGKYGTFDETASIGVGTRAKPLGPGKGIFHLIIKADGDWTVSVSQRIAK
jgi:hypothetical protein